MALKRIVKTALEGRGLRRFLRLRADGLSGLQLFNSLKQFYAGQGFSNADVSAVFNVFSGIGESGDTFNALSGSQRHLFKQIQVNPYLDRFDLVRDRVNYFVRVVGRVAGEESLHERIIRVDQPETLTRDEIEFMMGSEFGRVVYTESGSLASRSAVPIEFLEMSVIGATKSF